MPGEDAIKIEGLVREVLPNQLVRVGFKNGHRITAHLAARDRQRGRVFAPGETVTVEMSPGDFSQGRIRI